MTTASDIREALHQRHNKTSQGREGEQWICIEEARSGAGVQGNNGQCDFLAINTWQSRGMELIGYEIKVSLTDWRKELAKPEKAESFARFCKTWWVVVPSDLAAKIDHEVPTNWGLLSVNESGRCAEKIRPVANRNPDPVPTWYWIGWLAQIDRQHKRRLPYLTAFEKATGLHLQHIHKWDIDRLGKMIQAIRRHGDLSGVANQMRTAVEMIDAVMAEADALPAEVEA